MSKNWIGTVVLVCLSLTAGMFFSQMLEQVQGQPTGFSLESQPVVVNQPPTLPKWCVDFVPLPSQQGRPAEMRAITIVDPEAKKIAVYHVNVVTGQVWWLSTRNIQPDLTVNQFNATSPLPADMIKEIQQSQGQK